MVSKNPNLISDLRTSLSTDEFWSRILTPENEKGLALHLAIFREPYLNFIMEGRKTVESRFAKRPCPPFNRVKQGDVILLKRSAGKIVGLCMVDKVWFYKIEPHSLSFIKDKFGKAICPADNSFWEERKLAACATLMLISHVSPLNKIAFKKSDRRGWVVVKDPRQKVLL